MSAPAVCLTVAPNGARRGKADHAAIPLAPVEIAAEALLCARQGASILHLHVRDGDGAHSLDAGRYREAIAAVRELSDIVVQPTTERVGRFAPADMMAVQRALTPEMITFNLNELLDPDDEAQTGAVRDFLAETAAAGTVPQYIIYSLDQLRLLVRWWEAGWLPQAEPWVLIVLGRYSGTTSRPTDILAYLPHVPERWRWGVCAFGAPELACVTQAALAGGHCRVGFENNMTAADGRPLRDNADQVTRLAEVLGALGIGLMSAAEVRTHFGLKAVA
ncbi:3-keto-5-aminohexanoate cleavage protein [Nitrogeniibacter mangrovi]|uniref:3-keto-5-aminohexanoate cleavage protein n=1 Tax=Nitrogeniibacter mangrovi TaxID=2016596 RepID=A0A6C1B4D5_9RHOO|nr:3-keto-5-aminohexanoate cleavage protein [Nitrogeniibacter mangrovi]QID17054.1 3-keto-5-aminohexanoate cleavage protein [Nitrogeniibacter mangrovi]